MTDESATVQREEKEKIMVLRNLFDFQISEISGNLETNFSIANVSGKLSLLSKLITTFWLKLRLFEECSCDSVKPAILFYMYVAIRLNSKKDI